MAHIPKEQQTAYQRWEMKSFGDFRPSTLARIAAEEAAAAPPPPQQQPQQQEPEYAEPEAPHVLYPSEEELAAIREEARIEGYGAGYAAGHAEGHADAIALGKEETDQKLLPLRDLAANFSAALHGADTMIAAEVLELALQLSRAMLKQALQVKPSLILPIVREAIEYLPALQPPALLMLNPEDAEVVREGIGEELDKGGWRVIDDPTIERGGCKVETASNQIDAQTSARWARLTHALGKNVDWLD